jgi:DNA-binding transcriptional regulator YdaS (Cro superfamily)
METKRNWDLKGRIIQRFGSQINFAPIVKIHPTKISMIINGHRQASQEEARSIAEALGADVKELFV